MEPGIELDALIARHVMEYEFQPPSDANAYCNHCGRLFQGFMLGYSPDYCQNRCHYSTDEAATWRVVRAMREKGYRVVISGEGAYTKVGFYGEHTGVVTSTFAHAVCVAALWALGVSDD